MSSFPTAPAKVKTAEQLYTAADLARMLKVPAKRLKALMDCKELLGPDVLIPGGCAKGRRWTASRVNLIQAKWSPHALSNR